MHLFTTGLLFLFSFSFASAQTDCPFGLVNDPAPGICVRYIDTDNNSLCDLSEVPLEKDYGVNDKSDITYLSEAEIKEKTVKEVAESYGIETGAYRTALSDFLKIEVKGGDSLLFLHDNYGLCSGVAGSIALSLKENQFFPELNNLPESEAPKSTVPPRYKFLPIVLTVSFFYFLTLLLVKRKTITRLTHKRIWNVVLLISFLISALLAILLIIRLNWGIQPRLPFNMLY